MKDLIIVGAGGFGRDVLYTIEAVNAVKTEWNIKGFIDDNLNALDNVKCDYSIIGTISEWKPSDNEIFALAISTPVIKERVVSLLKDKGAAFATIIHPQAYIPSFVEIGEGSVLTAFTALGDNVKIGRFVHIMASMIGQDTVVGDYTTTTAYANIATGIVGKRVFIGSHSVLLGHRTIGDDAFVCAGSIVYRNVKPNTKVFGNPAIKANF
jgi:sugar O-acyltransferase (sialic acid O-acetyltransferase NeuD family)